MGPFRCKHLMLKTESSNTEEPRQSTLEWFQDSAMEVRNLSRSENTMWCLSGSQGTFMTLKKEYKLGDLLCVFGVFLGSGEEPVPKLNEIVLFYRL